MSEAPIRWLSIVLVLVLIFFNSRIWYFPYTYAINFILYYRIDNIAVLAKNTLSHYHLKNKDRDLFISQKKPLFKIDQH